MNIIFSTDKSRLNIERIHAAVKSSYWGDYRTLELTKRTIENSMCFGAYDDHGFQVGFARVLTDKVVFAYLMDVIVFEPFKGKGIGKMLVNHILDHPDVREVLTVALKTKDAHGLYEPLGFEIVGDSKLWMAKDKTKYN